jgi:hypothetical protein
MTRGDAIVEKGAERLRELSEKAAAQGGVAAKLAEPLAEDADFLRKLKPSLIRARARGDRVDQPPPAPTPRVDAGHKDGANPIPVLGAALAAGVITAKVLDWRGHAHPRG